MKIFGIDINIGKTQDLSVDRPQTSEIVRTVATPVQLYRVKADIQRWRNAVSIAESVHSPQRRDLYQLYQETVLDAHLSACMMIRKNLLMSLDFDVVDKDGNESEEMEKIIEAKWFRDFIDLSVDSIFYGHSLIQFDSIVDNQFKNVELVPREYVKPEFHIVTSSYSALTGNDYLENPWKNWCIGVGKSRDLGLLMKATPLVIWKKNAIGAWAEYIQMFGTPIRIGKTNLRNEATRGKMEEMLRNMSVGAYGVFDTQDIIEIIESGKSDAYNVFDKLMERCNSEISKLILGQTGTMDEKSFVGAAEVHERTFEKVGFVDEYFIENVCNLQLIPMLTRLGMWKDGYKIKISKDNEFSLSEKSKFDVALLNSGKFTFDPQYIFDNYGSEVIPVEQSEFNSVSNVKNAIDKIYK